MSKFGFTKDWMRTHYCGTIGQEMVDQEVVLNGWVRKRRDLGGVVFIDLWDKTGVVQTVFNPELCKAETHSAAGDLRSEYVVALKGKVRVRPEGTENPNIPTGNYEVLVDELNLLAKSEALPFMVGEETDEVDEMIRLNYRYLDLRRDRMQANLRTRAKVVNTIRNYMADHDYLEVETPLLVKSTPEGARDYLVPARLMPGAFFALPQSPQIFKQILMIGGVDKYYQIAKCFRDEDLRADRQPEFTQLDIECSFPTEETIHQIIEGVLKKVWKDVLGVDFAEPFPSMTWHEAMRRFGSDKPDLRIPYEIVNAGEVFDGAGFAPFQTLLDQGGVVKVLPLPGGASLSRKATDDVIAKAKALGAPELAAFQLKEEGLKGPLCKFLSEERQAKLIELAGLKVGDALFLMAHQDWKLACTVLGSLRLELARANGHVGEGWKFLWVTEFPMYEWDEEGKRWNAQHHPFTMPNVEDLDKLVSDPGSVRSRAYDVVLNGVELGSGSIRIHDEEIQATVFQALGFTPEAARERFGFLLDALKFGTPPHGGMALGLDRICMLLCGAKTIRDNIAFPKTARAQCLMSQAPSAVEEKQLDELGLVIRPLIK